MRRIRRQWCRSIEELKGWRPVTLSHCRPSRIWRVMRNHSVAVILNIPATDRRTIYSSCQWPPRRPGSTLSFQSLNEIIDLLGFGRQAPTATTHESVNISRTVGEPLRAISRRGPPLISADAHGGGPNRGVPNKECVRNVRNLGYASSIANNIEKATSATASDVGIVRRNICIFIRYNTLCWTYDARVPEPILRPKCFFDFD